MELTLKSDPIFLHKKGLSEVIVKKIGPRQYTVTSGNFKQVIKEPEYQELLSVSEVVKDAPAQEKEEPTDAEVAGLAEHLTPREERVVELNDLTKAVLLPMAQDLYEDVDKKAKKPELIELIVKAEFQE